MTKRWLFVAILCALATFFSCCGIRKDNIAAVCRSDMDAAETWLGENIFEQDGPPVFFFIGEKTSEDISWIKQIGQKQPLLDRAGGVGRFLRKVEYFSETEKLKISLDVITYPGYPAVEIDASLSNVSGRTTDVLRAFSSLRKSLGSCVAGKCFLHYNSGSAGYSPKDYAPWTAEIDSEPVRLSSGKGMPTCDFLPFFNAESEGGGVIVAVNSQGSWFAEFKKEKDSLALTCGQDNMESVMYAGESFRFPGVLLLFYKDSDWQGGQNVWRRFILERNLMRNSGGADYTQNLYLCSDLSGPDSDRANLENISASKLPEKYNCAYEFDAGWYGNSPKDWYGSVGNWIPSPAYSGGEMKKISDLCHRMGLKFCLWMEPERLYIDSEASAILKDNAIYLDENGEYLTYREARVKSGVMGLINYGKKEAQDFVFELVSSAVKEYGIDIYRQDFNTENARFWTAYDKYEEKNSGNKRRGATENHACAGYLRTWERISLENPRLIFDACAGGGRRYDLETLRYGFMHTKSDYWEDAVSQQAQNFGAYSWHILTGTGFADPKDIYDVRSRLTLSIGIGAKNIDGTMEEALREWSVLQKYLTCDYYQLTEYSLEKNASLALQFCDSRKQEGMLIAYLRSGGKVTLKAKALEPHARYEIFSLDDPLEKRTITGERLMRNGLELSGDGSTPSAPVLFYKKI